MLYIRGNFSDKTGVYVFLGLGTVFMLVALAMLAFVGNKTLQEQGYQSGQCTVTAEQLQHTVSTTTNTDSYGHKTSTSTDVYAPHFEYTLHTADAHSYTANGYDGWDTYTSDRSGQQAIVDHYTIGQSYQCWYNPANPTQAILVRQTGWLLILLGGGFLLIGGIFLVVGIGLFRTEGRSWRYFRQG